MPSIVLGDYAGEEHMLQVAHTKRSRQLFVGGVGDAFAPGLLHTMLESMPTRSSLRPLRSVVKSRSRVL
jgi:hypothetical protein